MLGGLKDNFFIDNFKNTSINVDEKGIYIIDFYADKGR